MLGIPRYRTLVQYVPQHPSLLPGTPLDFLTTIQKFGSRKADDSNTTNTTMDPMELAQDWGLDKTYWRREWSTLSGGEAQRMALAISVGIGGAEVILLDGQCVLGLCEGEFGLWAWDSSDGPRE